MTAPAIVQEFRDGLARGELLLQHCKACDRLNMYPRYACPHCQSDALDWQRAKGTGQLMSFTILRAGAPLGFEDELPYALAVIRLIEGVQLLGRLIPDEHGEWSNYRCDGQVAYVAGLPSAVRQYPSFGPATTVPLE